MNKLVLMLVSGLMTLTLSSCNNTSDTSFSSEEISSSSNSEDLPLNKRPVWILGHHCNSNNKIEDYDTFKALNSGCNGVEVDLAHRASDDQIILWHFGESVEDAETLTHFLSLPEMSDDRMTMVVFDIKDSEYIKQIVDTTHNFYKDNANNQRVHFVYSVSELSKLKIDNDPYSRFREIASKLWINEALEIDYENDANAVQEMFNDIKFTRGIFGNGIFSGQARGNIENSCKDAIYIRDNDLSNPYRFKAVESWTVNTLENKNYIIYENVGLAERIDWGCDIIFVDGFKSLDKSLYSSFYVNELFNQNKTVRLANISDYPFGDVVE